MFDKQHGKYPTLKTVRDCVNSFSAKHLASIFEGLGAIPSTTKKTGVGWGGRELGDQM